MTYCARRLRGQDKAIKRFSVRNMVEAGAMNDLKLACFYDGES